jgi:hypothetical protein
MLWSPRDGILANILVVGKGYQSGGVWGEIQPASWREISMGNRHWQAILDLGLLNAGNLAWPRLGGALRDGLDHGVRDQSREYQRQPFTMAIN